MNPLTIALIYDFDGTLSPGNMQEHHFIPAVGMENHEFWGLSDRMAREQDADPVLCYMQRMILQARSCGISLKRDAFRASGTRVSLYPGVQEWFGRINAYAASKGIAIQHYINSSGLKEMIEGTSIAHEFRKIFACSFLYDEAGEACWPAAAVNYTNKTQFLFKINKGVDSVWDSIEVNRRVPEEQRAVPFPHMIYLGDGTTDIPCMVLVKQQGGHSIAVYNPDKGAQGERDLYHLVRDSRVNYICPADYSADAPVDRLVRTIIDKIEADDRLKRLTTTPHEDHLRHQ